MSKRDFATALRRVDHALGAIPVPPSLDERLGRTVARRERRRAWLLPAAAALAAAVAVVIVFLAERRGGGAADPVQVEGSAVVRREPAGLRIVSGIAKITVAHQPAGAPALRILVSHGTIEVVGTRFTVEQGDAGGRVELHEGIIRFVAPDGASRQLAPGESLRWPLVTASPSPPAAAPPTSPPGPAPAPEASRAHPRRGGSPAPAPLDAEGVLERVAVLRSRGQLEAAVTTLDEALAVPLGAATRERLSFEKGSILTWRIADRGRACAHWKTHVGRRYLEEIERARRHLRCEELDP